MHPENTKPAATVHGTGSGEATCQCWNYMSDGCDLHGNRPLPTPPASPTVTIKAFLQSKFRMYSIMADTYDGSSPTLEEVIAEYVALLRAAERQK